MDERLRFGLFALALCFGACGGDEDEDEDDHGGGGCGLQENCTNALTFSHGLQVESDDGGFEATVLDGELSVADNAWTLAITDANGDPVTDATLVVSAWSVDCLHGGPTPDETVNANDDGEYVISPVFAHGGPWQVRLSIDSGEVENMVMEFCAPGEDHPGEHNHNEE